MPTIEKLLRDEFKELAERDIVGPTLANKRYEKNTLGISLSLECAIALKDALAIKKLFLLAIEHGFEIQTISSGNNWGYGSLSIKGTKPLVLLDLSEMNQILPIDKDLGLISLEPGVTQQQLYDYLKENSWCFMVPVTGAGPSCSIVSNALERGYGITPHTDHFASVNKMSAIIPNPDLWEPQENNGYLYKSGIESLDLSEEKFIDHTFKWGLGSYVEGLFTQSSFAVVTKMTIRLAAKPEAFSSFYIKINNQNKLPAAIDFIRDTLRDFDGIVGAINLMDKRRILSMVSENPNSKGDHVNMTAYQIDDISKVNGISEWFIAGSIYGKKPVVKAVKKVVAHQAKFADNIVFSDGMLVKIGKLLTSSFPKIFPKSVTAQITALEEGVNIMLGKPQQVALPLAYWRNPENAPDKSRLLNPDKDGCGILWYAPLIQMNNEKIESFVKFIRETTPKYNIEPLITFTNLKHDCIDATIPLIYDVNNDKAKADAHACLDELLEQGRILGFVPYRLNVKQQHEMLSAGHPHWKVVKTIKDALDPHGVLSSNRYNPL
jgi:4-cresol dehydrogenase (hydroxylating)